MSIHYFAEKVRKPNLRYRLISNWLKLIIASHTKDLGNISYVFCDDNYLLEINRKYLNHDFFTDIVTFDYVENDLISGDVFVSTERVSDNSVKFGVNLEDEFLRVICHGVLHLLKYNDHDGAEREFMRKKESEFISLFKKIENGCSFEV
jgi:probable rRNA maturation factor